MENSTSTAVEANSAPLALLDLEVPGKTGPIPTGELGINRAAAQDNFPQNGLQIFILPWSAMGEGDGVQVLLGGDVVKSDLIDDTEVNQRLTLFIDSARLTNGLTTLAYRVTRFGQQPENSSELPAYVKLTLPGGNDQNGDTPGHSELHLEIDQEYIENGVDKEQAKEGVPVLIKAYPNMAEHDDIRLSWGGQFVDHTVLKAEVGTDILITVDEETILAAGDSGSEGLAVTFEVYDLVDNRSEDWSAEIRLVVDTGSTRLDAPIIKEAVNNVLDLDVLGDKPATAQIIALAPDFAVNDQIEVTLRGTAADGTPVSFTCPPKPVTSVPGVPEVLVPNAHVRLLAQTQAIFTYRLIKQDASVLTAKGRFVSVIGEVKRLLAPIARDASQGSLDPALVRTTIVIPWDDTMDEGQVIDLKWLGVRPDQSIYFPELDFHTISHNEFIAKAPIPITVLGTHLAAINGGTLELYYELLSDVMVRALVRRESVHAAVLNVGEPRAELPAPDVEGEVEGVLDPEEVPAGTRLIVRKYNGIAPDDEVHCEWVGSITGKYEDYVKLNSITATRDVPFDIRYELIADNLGGTVEASYFVNRASGQVSVSNVLPLHIGEAGVIGPVIGSEVFENQPLGLLPLNTPLQFNDNLTITVTVAAGTSTLNPNIPEFGNVALYCAKNSKLKFEFAGTITRFLVSHMFTSEHNRLEFFDAAGLVVTHNLTIGPISAVNNDDFSLPRPCTRCELTIAAARDIIVDNLVWL